MAMKANFPPSDEPGDNGGQNAVDLVDDRSPLPAQIFPFTIRAPRFLVGLARDRNHRTDPRFAPYLLRGLKIVETNHVWAADVSVPQEAA